MKGNIPGSRFWRGERARVPRFHRPPPESSVSTTCGERARWPGPRPRIRPQGHGEERLLAYSPLAIYCPGLVDPHREEADNAGQKEPDSECLQWKAAGDALEEVEELIKHKRLSYPGFILPVGFPVRTLHGKSFSIYGKLQL